MKQNDCSLLVQQKMYWNSVNMSPEKLLEIWLAVFVHAVCNMSHTVYKGKNINFIWFEAQALEGVIADTVTRLSQPFHCMHSS